MKVYDAANIRNVALVGHSGSGKTQLAAALLFDTGAVNRFGSVDDGTTVTDYDDEEVARKHTLSATPAWCEWQKTKINIIDTPGMANFLSDARAALRVADAAVVVVDAVAGAEVQTEKVWAEAESLGPAAAGRDEPPRPRAREPRAHARVPPGGVQSHRDADPDADRRGEGVQGRRRPGGDEGVHVLETATRTISETDIPASLADAAAARARR
jgi:elongation factor G